MKYEKMELLCVISDQYAGGWSYFVFCQKVSKMDPWMLLCVISDQSRFFCFIFLFYIFLTLPIGESEYRET